MIPLLERDLEHVDQHVGSRWEAFRGRDILVTGGTGFFGKWVLESWLWANERHQLDARAWVVSRNPDAFVAQMPHLAHRCITYVRGDVQTFQLPADLRLSHVIHAATPADVGAITASPLDMLDIIIGGTRRVLEAARDHGKPIVLLTSSGAIYGAQPASLTHVPETYSGAPTCDHPMAPYGEGKRTAEVLCAAFGRQHGLPWRIARCFAFVGPHLPLDGHYAVGNFIRDARAGGPVHIAGDGTPMRSYLYAADLTVWLWRILTDGAATGIYNVGSDVAISIADLARQVAAFYGCGVTIAKTAVQGAAASRYVPAIQVARDTLGLAPWIDLPQALERTEEFLAKNSPRP